MAPPGIIGNILSFLVSWIQHQVGVKFSRLLCFTEDESNCSRLIIERFTKVKIVRKSVLIGLRISNLHLYRGSALKVVNKGR